MSQDECIRSFSQKQGTRGWESLTKPGVPREQVQRSRRENKGRMQTPKNSSSLSSLAAHPTSSPSYSRPVRCCPSQPAVKWESEGLAKTSTTIYSRVCFCFVKWGAERNVRSFSTRIAKEISSEGIRFLPNTKQRLQRLSVVVSTRFTSLSNLRFTRRCLHSKHATASLLIKTEAIGCGDCTTVWKRKRKNMQAAKTTPHINQGNRATLVPSTVKLLHREKDGKINGDQEGCRLGPKPAPDESW